MERPQKPAFMQVTLETRLEADLDGTYLTFQKHETDFPGAPKMNLQPVFKMSLA